MKVLFVSGKFPTKSRPGTLAPVKRQLDSLRPYIAFIEAYEIEGPSLIKYFSATSTLRKRSEGFDIIHAHYGLCGFSAVCSGRVPVVLSLMGSDIQFSPSSESFWGRVQIRIEHILSRIAIRKAQSIIVKSSAMSEGILPVKSYIIPNGVDLGLFTPSDKHQCRDSLNIPQESYCVLFGGNPEDQNKNFKLAEQSLCHTEQILDSQVTCIYLVNIPTTMVPVYMNACDCMIFTSLQEGSPNVVKEALACNSPVVSVDVGDVSFLLDGIEGCFLCGYDAESLGRSVAEVLRSEKMIDGRAALTAKGLDMESVSQKILGVYKNVLDKLS